MSRRSTGDETAGSLLGQGTATVAGLAAGAIIGGALSAGAAPAEAGHWGGSNVYGNLTGWNGYSVFLSPAHHDTGDKAGCAGYIEERNMRKAAIAAATVTEHGAGGLRERGYFAKLGNSFPDDNIAASNGWGLIDMHIPMHSNGSTSDGSTCEGTLYRFEGLYRNAGNGGGNSLAQATALVANFDNIIANPPFPGVPPDQAGFRNGIAGPYNLKELGSTVDTVERAYIEINYHDNLTGYLYAKDYSDWGWRVGYHVDQYFGYP